MQFVDEPAERVAAQLSEQGATVRREPYNPRNRSLVNDLVGFLRKPAPGSTVTLFEDDEGRVRYYTVARGDPEIEALKARIEKLSPPEGGGIEPARIDLIEKRLARVDALEERVAAIQTLEAKVAAVERLPELEKRVESLAKLEPKVSALEPKVAALDILRTRVERLERPS
jgi:hypothetical protein